MYGNTGMSHFTAVHTCMMHQADKSAVDRWLVALLTQSNPGKMSENSVGVHKGSEQFAIITKNHNPL